MEMEAKHLVYRKSHSPLSEKAPTEQSWASLSSLPKKGLGNLSVSERILTETLLGNGFKDHECWL